MNILQTSAFELHTAAWVYEKKVTGVCCHVQVVGIAKEAVDRLSAKLAAVKGSGQSVDMAEEFRMLTLQVIGEAILSLPPEECDQVRRQSKASGDSRSQAYGSLP